MFSYSVVQMKTLIIGTNDYRLTLLKNGGSTKIHIISSFQK